MTTLIRRVPIAEQYGYYELHEEDVTPENFADAVKRLEAWALHIKTQTSQNGSPAPALAPAKKKEPKADEASFDWDSFIEEHKAEVEAKRREIGADVINEQSAAMIVARELGLTHATKSAKSSRDSDQITYVATADEVFFSVPFAKKDSFKQTVKDRTGSWPKWSQSRKAWTVPSLRVNYDLLDALRDSTGLEVEASA